MVSGGCGTGREQPVDQRRDGLLAQAGREDRADHLLHRPGARDRPAGSVQRGERVGLAVSEVLGVL